MSRRGACCRSGRNSLSPLACQLATERLCLPPSVLTQVEEGQQAPQPEEKKGKGKSTGKRFEIKKWNAVAM